MQAWLKNNRQLLLRGAGTLLALVLLVILLSQSGEKLWAAFQRISVWNLALALGCIIASRLSITARWHVLLRAGEVKIPFKDTAALVFTGLFANNFLPTTIGGDVVRLAGAMQLGYDRAICLASIAADRVVNLVGMSLAAPLGLWQVLAVSGPLQSLALAGFWQKGREFILKTLQALTIWLKKPASLLAALGFALLHMLCSFGANYILLQALGEGLALWKVIGLFSLAYFIGLVPVSINGYGVSELTVTFLLAQFGGISLPASAAVAVVHRLLMMLVSLPGAYFLPGVLAKMDKHA